MAIPVRLTEGEKALLPAPQVTPHGMQSTQETGCSTQVGAGNRGLDPLMIEFRCTLRSLALPTNRPTAQGQHHGTLAPRDPR